MRIYLYSFIILVISITCLRIWRARTVAKSRVKVLLVPSDNFDPNLDLALSWLSTLEGYTRYGWWYEFWYPRQVSGFRFEWTCLNDRKVGLFLTLPSHSKRFLSLKIPGVKVVENYENLTTEESFKVQILREMCPARKVLPLKQVDFRSVDHLLQAIGDSETGYMNLSAVIDVFPLSRKDKKSRKKEAYLLNDNSYKGQAFFDGIESAVGELLGFSTPSKTQRPLKSNNLGGIQRREFSHRDRSVAGTLTTPEPIFYVNVWFKGEGENRKFVKSSINKMISNFKSFDGEQNYWRTVRKLPLITNTKIVQKIIRFRFDREVMKFKHSVMATSIFPLLIPSTVKDITTNRFTSENLNRAVSLPTFEPNKNMIPLGWFKEDQSERLIGTSLDDMTHSFICGTTGYGKTHLGVNQLIERAEDGDCIIFLDPHGQAIADVKSNLKTEQERFIELCFDRSSNQQVLGWNPLKTSGYSETQIQARMQSFINGFEFSQKWDTKNTRGLTILTMSVQALIEVSKKLPAHLAPTIFQITDLLENAEFREILIQNLQLGHIREWWESSFPSFEPSSVNPVCNAITKMRVDQNARAVFGQSDGQFNIDQAIVDKKIVLLRMNGIGAFSQTVATWVMTDIIRAIFGQKKVDTESYISAYFDEVQSYENALGKEIQQILEQLRKFGVKATFLTQNPETLTPRTQQALFTNANLISASRLSHSASKLISDQTGVPQERYKQLNKREFITTTVNNEKSHHIQHRTASHTETRRFRLTPKDHKQETNDPTVNEALEHIDLLTIAIKNHLSNEQAPKFRPTAVPEPTITYEKS